MTTAAQTNVTAPAAARRANLQALVDRLPSPAAPAAPAEADAGRLADRLVRHFDHVKYDYAYGYSGDYGPYCIPKDGVLDRGEFPIARFDAVDGLIDRNGKIGAGKLEYALRQLPAERRQAIEQAMDADGERASSLGTRFAVEAIVAACGGFLANAFYRTNVGLAVLGGGTAVVAGVAAIKAYFRGNSADHAVLDAIDRAFDGVRLHSALDPADRAN